MGLVTQVQNSSQIHDLAIILLYLFSEVEK